MIYYSCTLKMPFHEVLERMRNNLSEQGFGIVTTIDLEDTFKQKLDVDFRKYKILGACNPQLAYKAVSLESHMGIMLPCNVIIQEHENGEVEVSAVNPLENIDRAFNTTELTAIAEEVAKKLRSAIDALHREAPEEHCDALPGGPQCNCIFPILG